MIRIRRSSRWRAVRRTGTRPCGVDIGRLRVQGLAIVRRKRIYDIPSILQIRNRNVTESTLAGAEPEERITELR
jgi:hypothetical protein